jgi:signal peptidase I
MRIKRGDVIILDSPHHSKTLIIKRVIGLPGDLVQPRDPFMDPIVVPEGFFPFDSL